MSIENSIKIVDRSPSVSSISTSENLISNYIEFLCQFNYEKAKNIIEKHREYKDTAKSWNLLQNGLVQLVNTEKFYNNIQFLNQKTSAKDKTYEIVNSNLEQLIKDGNINSTNTSNKSILRSQQQQTILASSLDIHNLIDFITQLIQFTDYRLQMINIYLSLKEKETLSIINNILANIDDIEKKLISIIEHTLLDPLKNLFILEITILKTLLECHLTLSSNFNFIQALFYLQTINELFNSKVPQLNIKQTKELKGFFFNRSIPQQKQLPVLYQWFKIYHQSLINKLSLLMYDSMNQIAPLGKLNEIDGIMNEKIDLYTKIINFVKKNNVYLCAILIEIDHSRIFDYKNYNLNGFVEYQLKDESNLFTDSDRLNVIDRFPVIFSYPKIQINQFHDKHMNHVIKLTYLDSTVGYTYDETLKSTYYVCKIQNNWSFCIIYELNKQENKNKTAIFIQEVCAELNLTKVFQLFNTNLK